MSYFLLSRFDPQILTFEQQVLGSRSLNCQLTMVQTCVPVIPVPQGKFALPRTRSPGSTLEWGLKGGCIWWLSWAQIGHGSKYLWAQHLQEMLFRCNMCQAAVSGGCPRCPIPCFWNYFTEHENSTLVGKEPKRYQLPVCCLYVGVFLSRFEGCFPAPWGQGMSWLSYRQSKWNRSLAVAKVKN